MRNAHRFLAPVAMATAAFTQPAAPQAKPTPLSCLAQMMDENSPPLSVTRNPDGTQTLVMQARSTDLEDTDLQANMKFELTVDQTRLLSQRQEMNLKSI